MVAPLPQERLFKREFDQTRLAALRGDSFQFPDIDDTSDAEQTPDSASDDFSPIDTPETRRFFARDSEDGLLRQYPQAASTIAPDDDSVLDPANFAFMQRQAQMQAGIGAPELLPPEAADVLDPEYSTEDEPVTYGESVGALQGLAQRAMELEEVQAISGEIREKSKEAVDRAAEELQKVVKEKTNRLLAKGIGNGGNVSDIFSWDFWIVFAITYLYLMARGAVSLLSPESNLPQDFATFKAGARYATTKALHVLFPPYRPLLEPVDFAYFMGMFIASVILLGLIVTFFVLFIFPMILPLMMPGAATSAL